MVLHYGDLTDTTNLVYVISQVRPTEIYNLAAQSHVKVSFDMAEYTVRSTVKGTRTVRELMGIIMQGDVDGLGTLRLLDAIRTCGLTKHVRFYQVSCVTCNVKVILAHRFHPGLDLRTLRESTRDSADREDALLPSFAIWVRQTLRILDSEELPRIIRDARLERHSLQSRIAKKRADIRNAEDHKSSGRNFDGYSGLLVPWKSGRDARLGTCSRLRRGNVEK